MRLLTARQFVLKYAHMAALHAHAPMPHLSDRSIYSDGRSKDSKQSLISWIVAVVTMTAYTGALARLKIVQDAGMCCLWVGGCMHAAADTITPAT